MTVEQSRVLKAVHDLAREQYVMILSDECEVVLKGLFEKYSPKRVLEIGTAIGYSSSVMALSSDCVIDTVEKDASRIERARELWKSLGVESRINVYCGDSDELLPSIIAGKTYDFVFIDGAKSAYRRQLELILPNVAKGGIILCDDVLYLGLVKGDNYPPHKHRTIVRNMREFLTSVEENDELELQLVEEGNGIAVIRNIRNKR
ncbi:MAG: class I SAM-dependent methyltransferase [Clostridia bacterium]|nr:class I SAM-dependent methyltransferase [Clostridia bacterium]